MEVEAGSEVEEEDEGEIVDFALVVVKGPFEYANTSSEAP